MVSDYIANTNTRRMPQQIFQQASSAHENQSGQKQTRFFILTQET
jgi:hypothetical protein